MTRIPEGLRRRLDREARRNDRSMNSEIIQRLERSFTNEDAAATIKHLNEMLDAFTRREASLGTVLAGWLSDELRKRGFDEPNTNEVVATFRASFARGTP